MQIIPKNKDEEGSSIKVNLVNSVIYTEENQQIFGRKIHWRIWKESVKIVDDRLYFFFLLYFSFLFYF